MYQSKADLILYINTYIVANGTNAITGPILNPAVRNMVDSLTQGGEVFIGNWNPNTNVITPGGAALPSGAAIHEGKTYKISVTGTYNLGYGTINVYAGNYITCINTVEYGYVWIQKSYDDFKSLFSPGDLIYGANPTGIAMLNPGTTGQVLMILGGVPTWVTLFDESEIVEDPEDLSTDKQLLITIGSRQFLINAKEVTP